MSFTKSGKQDTSSKFQNFKDNLQFHDFLLFFVYLDGSSRTYPAIYSSSRVLSHMGYIHHVQYRVGIE